MKKSFLILLFVSNFAVLANDMIYDAKYDSDWLPVTYVLNGTFDVIQNPYWFNQRNYSDKLKVVWDRIRKPDHNIKKDGGYKKLVQDEVFSSRVLPNIGLHFLGGAYDTLWLTEYFENKGYFAPRLWSFVLTYTAHLGNEAFETTSDEISSHDHIADIYLYDVAAFIMAQNTEFMSFLLNDLDMKAWHFNPVYDVDSDDFFNAGLNYVFRPEAFSLMQGKLRPLYFLGMQTLAGASYRYSDGRDISVAAGISLTNPLKQKGRFVTGVFHETNERLDASLFLNGSEDFRVRLNIYDNLFKNYIPQFDNFDLSLVLGMTKGPAYAAGLSINMPFGIGGVKNSKPINF